MALPISMSDSSTAVEEKRNNVNTTFLYPICLYSISISYIPLSMSPRQRTHLCSCWGEIMSTPLSTVKQAPTFTLTPLSSTSTFSAATTSGKTLVVRNNEDACLVHFQYNFSHFLIWKWKCDIEDWKLKQADLRSKAIMVSGAPASECLE